MCAIILLKAFLVVDPALTVLFYVLKSTDHRKEWRSGVWAGVGGPHPCAALSTQGHCGAGLLWVESLRVTSHMLGQGCG